MILSGANKRDFSLSIASFPSFGVPSSALDMMETSARVKLRFNVGAVLTLWEFEEIVNGRCRCDSFTASVVPASQLCYIFLSK